MISPLRYPGGKAKLFPFFAELISLNKFYNWTYAEPYAGGAGLALKLLSHGYVSSIEINDVDPAIFCFWQSLLGSTERFCNKIDSVELSVAEWRRQRDVYRLGIHADEFDLGFAAYYLNRTSRSGIIEGSGPIGGYEQQGAWKVDARFNRKAQLNQVREIGRFSSVIKVTNLDALAFCDTRMNAPRTLIYLDPPYYVKGQKLYKNFYKDRDHREIAKFLEASSNANWVLSYDFVPEIVEMYGSFDPIIYDLPYSAGPSTSGSEVIFAGRSILLPNKSYLPRAA